MIHIANFDTIFKGRKFKDLATDIEYVCVGYGDCTNAPYWVGIATSINRGNLTRTILFRTAEFLPVPSNPVV